MSRTVLVTGASGRIGELLVAELQRRGWEVRALVHRRPVPSADQRAQADLTARPDLSASVAGVAAVVHLAAITHARDPRRYGPLNVGGTRWLVEAVRAAGDARIVYVSTRTASERGGAYSASKLEAERAVIEAGPEHVIVRLPEVYGAGALEGVDSIISRASRGEPIPLVGRGDDMLCPLHVEDAIAALAGAVAAERAASRTYTLAGECVPAREFAQACVEAFGSSGRVFGVPSAAVWALCRLGRVLPIPAYPDQLARLRAPRPEPTQGAAEDLGFAARPLAEGLAGLAATAR